MNPTSTAHAYPIARKDNVVDNYHGAKIKDPYRWLENPEGGDTREYVQAQQEFFEAFMSDTPREAYAARLRELSDYVRWGVPVARGGKWFYLKNDGLSNQPTLYVQQGQHGQPKTLIDPNTLSERGTVFLSGFWPSPDGSLLAYTTSEDGSDWQVVHILNVESGEVFQEKIQWTKFTTVVWSQGSSGFFYNRLPQPGTVPPEDQHHFCRVFYHRVDTPQDQDELIHEESARKELSLAQGFVGRTVLDLLRVPRLGLDQPRLCKTHLRRRPGEQAAQRRGCAIFVRGQQRQRVLLPHRLGRHERAHHRHRY